MNDKNKTLLKRLEEIERDKELSEVEKLTQCFDAITQMYLEEYSREIEIQMAMQDEENLVKTRIQRGMIETTRGIFSHCHIKATGKPAWSEKR